MEVQAEVPFESIYTHTRTNHDYNTFPNLCGRKIKMYIQKNCISYFLEIPLKRYPINLKSKQ